jgi:hypothetical protein
VGLVLACAIIIGGVIWYSSRPRPWNADAVRAYFSTPLYNVDDNWNVKDIDLEYIVYNSTSTDFTLSPDDTLLLIDKDALRASYSGNYKLSRDCFVPARTKVKWAISAPADFNTSFEIDGFALFESESRYKIIFPKPTEPTPDDRKKKTRRLRKNEKP